MNTYRQKKYKKKKSIQDNVEEINQDNGILYKLLNLERSASQQDIKRQFKLLALQFHPDKNPNKDFAKDNFQKIVEAYQILTDPIKKKIYDEKGIIDNNNDTQQFESAYQYFRTMYKKVEKEDIENFAINYKYSEEEISDVCEFYRKNKGNITLILEEIILSSNEDIPRFIQIIENQIQNKIIKRTKKYEISKNLVRFLTNEEEKAQKILQKQKFSDLENNILAKQHQQHSFLDGLEQKYCKEKDKIIELPNESEFDKIQKSLLKQKKQKKKN